MRPIASSRPRRITNSRKRLRTASQQPPPGLAPIPRRDRPGRRPIATVSAPRPGSSGTQDRLIGCAGGFHKRRRGGGFRRAGQRSPCRRARSSHRVNRLEATVGITRRVSDQDKASDSWRLSPGIHRGATASNGTSTETRRSPPRATASASEPQPAPLTRVRDPERMRLVRGVTSKESQCPQSLSQSRFCRATRRST